MFNTFLLRNWPIKYALNTHMWCAIIVNKQISLCATRKSKNNEKKKMLKNFHWNLNFFFEKFLRFSTFSFSLKYENFSLQPRIYFTLSCDCYSRYCMWRKFQSLYFLILMTTQRSSTLIFL